MLFRGYLPEGQGKLREVSFKDFTFQRAPNEPLELVYQKCICNAGFL